MCTVCAGTLQRSSCCATTSEWIRGSTGASTPDASEDSDCGSMGPDRRRGICSTSGCPALGCRTISPEHASMIDLIVDLLLAALMLLAIYGIGRAARRLVRLTF